MRRFALFLLSALLLCGEVRAASTIDPTKPVQGQPYNASPIRQNFGNAANDINALQSMNAGASPPSSPAPGTFWLNTTDATTYVVNLWNGAAWITLGSIDVFNNVWMPPIGGGLLPSLLSAATTDLGSVPQATLYITGANSIFSFGSTAPAGTIKYLIFNGAATLIEDAVAMVLPGAANITAVPGDFVVALALGSGDWQVLTYQAIIGALSVAQGGTGRASLTVHNVLLGEGTNAVGFAPPGVLGQPLVSVGPTVDPAFGGIVTAPYGGSGLASPTPHAVLLGEGALPFGVAIPGIVGQPFVSGGPTVDPAFGGIIGVPFGGTSLGILTAHAVMLGAGVAPVAFVGPGTAQYPLLASGPSADPSFQPLNLAGVGVTGILPISNLPAGTRIILTGSAHFCVSSVGSNDNDGISPNCWQTLQYAWSFMAARLDMANNPVTIDILPGTYDGFIAHGPLVGTSGPKYVIFSGDVGAPGNVVIIGISSSAVEARDGAKLTLRGVSFKATSPGSCISVLPSGTEVSFERVVFDACAAAHMSVMGGAISTDSSVTPAYSISASSLYHIIVKQGGSAVFDNTIITLTALHSFSTFAVATAGGQIEMGGDTFVGSALGQRYDANLNGVINTNSGGNPTYLPGSAVGTTSTGGQYN
jgi:hypothetical protein